MISKKHNIEIVFNKEIGDLTLKDLIEKGIKKELNKYKFKFKIK